MRAEEPADEGVRRRIRPQRLLVLLAIVAVIAVVAKVTWRPVLAEVIYRSGVHRVEAHAEAIRYAAVESDVDPNLLAAIMLAESGGRVDVVSHADALGLYQLMLPTAKERARVLKLPEPTREQLLSDVALNARLGASYVHWLDQYYDGDLEKMLIAYNAGPGRLRKWAEEAGSYEAWRQGRIDAGDSGVLRYVKRVTGYRERFERRGVVLPHGTVLPKRPAIESGVLMPSRPGGDATAGE